MNLTLETLYKDHDNFRRILYLLEQLLIEIHRGTSQDYPMLQCILTYIQDYPERFHHPAEDTMFSVIFKNGVSDMEFHENIKALMKDHTDIERITRDAVEAVEPLFVSKYVDFTNIGNKLSTLINRQRSHILFEETKIYPYVAEHLDNTDWERISTLIPDHEDPIFGDRVRKEYELVFKAL